MESRVIKNILIVSLGYVFIYLYLNKLIKQNSFEDSFTKSDQTKDIVRPNVEKDNNIQELYNFVFNDNAEEQLNDLFSSTEVKIPEIKEKQQQTNIEMDNKQPILEKKQIKEAFNGNDGKLFEYQNENIMNGGPILGDVTGWDSFTSQFANII